MNKIERERNPGATKELWLDWSDEQQMERNDSNLKTFQRKNPHSVYFSHFFILHIQSATEISLRFQCWVTMEMVPLTVITKK